MKINSRLNGGYLEDKVNTDNVIIIYHWNSCGHCRELMPILYNLLSVERELRERSNIFEVEYSNFNFLPPSLTNVSAFPYIVAYKQGDKVEEFNDQRTPEKLKLFISRNSPDHEEEIQKSIPKLKTTKRSRSKKILKKYNTI